MDNVVYATMDKQDLEKIIRAYNDRLLEATDRWRLEEQAKDAFHEDVRPIVKKLAKFVELWEEADKKERASDDLTAARMARTGS